MPSTLASTETLRLSQSLFSHCTGCGSVDVLLWPKSSFLVSSVPLAWLLPLCLDLLLCLPPSLDLCSAKPAFLKSPACMISLSQKSPSLAYSPSPETLQLNNSTKPGNKLQFNPTLSLQTPCSALGLLRLALTFSYIASLLAKVTLTLLLPQSYGCWGTLRFHKGS